MSCYTVSKNVFMKIFGYVDNKTAAVMCRLSKKTNEWLSNVDWIKRGVPPVNIIVADRVDLVEKYGVTMCNLKLNLAFKKKSWNIFNKYAGSMFRGLTDIVRGNNITKRDNILWSSKAVIYKILESQNRYNTNLLFEIAPDYKILRVVYENNLEFFNRGYVRSKAGLFILSIIAGRPNFNLLRQVTKYIEIQECFIVLVQALKRNVRGITAETIKKYIGFRNNPILSRKAIKLEFM